jgi:hypothetical protein
MCPSEFSGVCGMEANVPDRCGRSEMPMRTRQAVALALAASLGVEGDMGLSSRICGDQALSSAAAPAQEERDRSRTVA